MKKSAILITIFSIAAFANAQQNDTVKKIDLKEVIIQDYKTLSEMARMPDVKENVIYAGKKTEVIQLDKINADLSTNNTRQVFAKVPGISIWENDGSGIQAGVASRGLSPNRSWEFNVRQNGYDVSSEVFGYPETYYTPPMEALVKIEVIRGASSLQYGPQFGGLLNYQIKKGNPNKAISYETQQTVGSYGLFNTYHAIGGTHKKFSYYGFLHHRSADGWRNNSRYNIQTVYFSANYQLSKKINLSGEYTNMNYKSQQPGGLTDVQFKDNHRQSLRERNWFGAPFNVASLTVKYDISQSVNLQIKSFATIAERNSVGFTKSITTTDSINQTTLQYNARQVDRDHYKNYGTEARVSIKYKFFEKDNIFAGGLRAYRGNTKRDQLGIGTTGNNYDLTLTNPQYGRSLEFGTTNYAAFAENIFQIGKRLKVVPGIRFDYIENQSEGYINTTQTGTINPDKKVRQPYFME
ncbi:MAG: TonB-dependent receptor [Saprospiraceae bacterium]|nr:TonB-dependent receptor [Candidatus Vicinibacter affinis]